MITALIYNCPAYDCTYYLGQTESDRLLSPREVPRHMRDAVETLRNVIPHEWDEDNLATVRWDLTFLPTPAVGEVIPDIYATIDTPNGPRWIAIPDIGDVLEGIHLRDLELYYAIDGEDISSVAVSQPDCPEYSDDDLAAEVYSVRVITHGEEDISVWIDDYPTIQAARSHASRIYWAHIADQPTLIDVEVTCDIMALGRQGVERGPVVWSAADIIRRCD